MPSGSIDFTIDQDNSRKLTIQSVTGNVGIGSTSPNYALDVNGDVNVATGRCFRVNGVCIGYTVKLAAIYATSTASGSATSTVVFTGAQGSAPSFSAGTLTLPSNTSHIVSEIWGGGGGGGGEIGVARGGGGGAGYSTKLYSSLSTKYYYRLGSGGTGNDSGNGTAGTVSSFGNGSATTTANGGSGGNTAGNGGAGGTASNGDVNLTGGAGGTHDTDEGGGGTGGNAARSGGGGVGGSVGSAPGAGGGGAANGAAGGLVLTIYATSSPTSAGNDYAEMFPVSSPVITAGDIVAVDTGIPVSMKRAVKGDGAPLAGVISTVPGQLLGDKDALGSRPVALAGRVSVKFSNENGGVKIGDRIAVSSTAGVGMRAGIFDDSVGIVIAPVEQTEEGETVMIFLDLRVGIDLLALGDALLGFSLPTTTSATSSESETATSTASTTEASATSTSSRGIVYERANSFLKGIFTAVTAWLADAGNGITEIFAKTITAENVNADTVNAKKLCLEDVCVTKEELQNLLNNAGQTAAAAGSGTTSPPVPEPEYPLEPEPAPDESASSTPPVPEPEPDPEPESQETSESEETEPTSEEEPIPESDPGESPPTEPEAPQTP